MPNGETKTEEGKLIGKVSHYFSKIGVAIIDLEDSLSVGDTVRIAGGDTDFNQTIDSMEIDRQKVEKAEKGSSVGVKVSQKAKEGYRVYKL